MRPAGDLRIWRKLLRGCSTERPSVPDSERVSWSGSRRAQVPRVCFVNKMDRLGADFYNCVKMVVSNLGARPLVIQLPIGAEDQFKGVIDLVKMKALVWGGEELGAKFEEVDIPADMADKVTVRAANCDVVVVAAAAARCGGGYETSGAARVVFAGAGAGAAMILLYCIMYVCLHFDMSELRRSDRKRTQTQSFEATEAGRDQGKTKESQLAARCTSPQGHARWPAPRVRDHRAPQRPLPCRLPRLHCVRSACATGPAEGARGPPRLSRLLP
jgi:hypothetical protein